MSEGGILHTLLCIAEGWAQYVVHLPAKLREGEEVTVEGKRYQVLVKECDDACNCYLVDRLTEERA